MEHPRGTLSSSHRGSTHRGCLRAHSKLLWSGRGRRGSLWWRGHSWRRKSLLRPPSGTGDARLYFSQLSASQQWSSVPRFFLSVLQCQFHLVSCFYMRGPWTRAPCSVSQLWISPQEGCFRPRQDHNQPRTASSQQLAWGDYPSPQSLSPTHCKTRQRMRLSIERFPFQVSLSSMISLWLRFSKSLRQTLIVVVSWPLLIIDLHLSDLSKKSSFEQYLWAHLDQWQLACALGSLPEACASSSLRPRFSRSCRPADQTRSCSHRS